MMYFMKGPFTPSSPEEEEQWDALLKFREKLPPEGFYSEFANAKEFERSVRRHLAGYLAQSPRTIRYRVPLSSLSSQSGESFRKYYNASRGEYRIRASTPKRRTGSDLRLPLTDFDFQVLARKVSGSNKSWYGAYIVQGRGSHQVKYHDFFVSGKGTYTYEVKTMDDAEKKQEEIDIIQRAQLAFAIKPGNSTNRIRLVRRESIVEFWVNESRILELSTTLSRLEEVQAGIAIHTERDLPPGKHIDAGFSEWVFYEPEQ